MNARWPWILFAVSACFNLFFIGAYLQTRRQFTLAQTPAGRAELIAQRLKLDAPQRVRYQELTTKITEQLTELQQNRSESINAFWTQLESNPGDAEKVRAGIGALGDAIKEAQALRFNYLLEILKGLGPEQRRLLIRIVREKDLYAQ